MKTNFKIGIGLSFGAMVLGLATIKAIENSTEKKYECKARIAEIEAEAKSKTSNQIIKSKEIKEELKQ